MELSGQVSKTIMYYYNSNFDISNKDDASPVTPADIAANDMIVTFLAKLTPNIYILSEEHIDAHPDDRVLQEWIWCVDPLDGTKEFIKKNGEFSVNIALIHKGVPKLGIVVLPFFDVVYFAISGNGAFRVSDGVSVRVGTKGAKSHGPIRVMTSRSHHNSMTEEVLSKHFDQIEWIPKGSSLKFTELAECKGDVYLKLGGTTMEWDIAAPQVILEESGGAVRMFPDGGPLRYNKLDLKNSDFIAVRNGFKWII